MPNDTRITILSAPQSADADLGTCDFVEHWCKKVEGKTAVTADDVEICGVCHSLFSSDSLLLSQIKVGAPDKLEQPYRFTSLAKLTKSTVRARALVSISPTAGGASKFREENI